MLFVYSVQQLKTSEEFLHLSKMNLQHQSEDSGISLSLSNCEINNDLHFESKRLLTFENWPVEAPIEPGRIAKAGFFFTGSGCEVQCFACQGRITKWDYGDQAVLRHRQINPTCPFLLNRSSNVPLNAATEVRPSAEDQQLLPAALNPSESSNHREALGNHMNQEPCIEMPDTSTRIPSPLRSPIETSEVPPDKSRPRTSTQSDGHIFTQPAPLPPLNSIPTSFNRPSTSTLSANQPSPRQGIADPSQGHTRSYLSHHDWLLLRREEVRLRSFDQRFTATSLNPLALAAAGFFYLGVADQVQCAFCRGVVRDWEPQDEPRQEHRRLFPSCPFILGLPVGNTVLGEGEAPWRSSIPSVVERTASLPVPVSGEDQIVTPGYSGNSNLGLTSPNGFEVTPQRFTPQMRPNASPDTETSYMQLNALIGDNLEELGIPKHTGPRYAAYTTVEARLKTFAYWPTRLKQTPRAMAQAGFFYLGTNDHVNCFHCGSGLRNWEPEDDPWLEHARWFPQCRFLLLMKGEQFVRGAATTATPRESSSDVTGSRVNTKNSGNKPPIRSYVPQQETISRELSESDLNSLLESTVAQTVLTMGVDISCIKQAYQQRIRSGGQPFSTVDSLLEATIEIHPLNEHRQPLDVDHEFEVVNWSEVPRTSQSSRTEQENQTAMEVTQEETEPGGPHSESMPDVAVETLTESGQPESTTAACPNEVNELSRTHMLEEEIRRLKEARLCKVCLDEDVSIAYIPCGHIVTCVQCAAALDHCPLCRKNIKGTVRIFFS